MFWDHLPGFKPWHQKLIIFWRKAQGKMEEAACLIDFWSIVLNLLSLWLMATGWWKYFSLSSVKSYFWKPDVRMNYQAYSVVRIRALVLVKVHVQWFTWKHWSIMSWFNWNGSLSICCFWKSRHRDLDLLLISENRIFFCISSFWCASWWPVR